MSYNYSNYPSKKKKVSFNPELPPPDNRIPSGLIKSNQMTGAEDYIYEYKNKDDGDTALKVPLWEVSLMQLHFHPSVQSFATSLLAPPHNVHFDGDPTSEFTIIKTIKTLRTTMSKTTFTISNNLRHKQEIR